MVRLVVCGLGVVIESRSPTRALKSVDLPVLGTPRTTMCPDRKSVTELDSMVAFGLEIKRGGETKRIVEVPVLQESEVGAKPLTHEHARTGSEVVTVKAKSKRESPCVRVFKTGFLNLAALHGGDLLVKV